MAQSWSQIATNHENATVGIPDLSKLWLSQIVTVQNWTYQIDVNSARWCIPKYRKQVHIDSRPFQECFLGTSFMVIITDIHTKRFTSEITPESANIKLFIFMSKMNMGTLPSIRNRFSVLLESICHVAALITNCNKSQIATIVSQFVTVAICDGSKYNFSDWHQSCHQVLLSAEKMFTSTSDLIKKVSFEHRLWAL